MKVFTLPGWLNENAPLTSKALSREFDRNEIYMFVASPDKG